jgi:hypothetical protein
VRAGVDPGSFCRRAPPSTSCSCMTAVIRRLILSLGVLHACSVRSERLLQGNDERGSFFSGNRLSIWKPRCLSFGAESLSLDIYRNCPNGLNPNEYPFGVILTSVSRKAKRCQPLGALRSPPAALSLCGGKIRFARVR